MIKSEQNVSIYVDLFDHIKDMKDESINDQMKIQKINMTNSGQSLQNGFVFPSRYNFMLSF